MTAVASAPKRSDLGVRTVTGVILILVALGCILIGGTPLWLFTTAAGLLIAAEWSAIIGAERWKRWCALIGLAVPLATLHPTIDVSDFGAPLFLGAVMLVVLAITRAPRLVLGMAYAGLPIIALSYIQRLFDGFGLTIWTIAIVVATDVGAYFAGRSIGGPKLAPTISPNKTWAGLIGGVACAGVAGVALAHLLDVPRQLAGFAGLLAIAAQAGDLYESAMKRRAGVKDSGSILPGHGGVMDRVDGLVPVVCLMAVILASGMV
jgi:phosphatidate cytidylyltransferase